MSALRKDVEGVLSIVSSDRPSLVLSVRPLSMLVTSSSMVPLATAQTEQLVICEVETVSEKKYCVAEEGLKVILQTQAR